MLSCTPHSSIGLHYAVTIHSLTWHYVTHIGSGTTLTTEAAAQEEACPPWESVYSYVSVKSLLLCYGNVCNLKSGRYTHSRYICEMKDVFFANQKDRGLALDHSSE